MAKAERVQSGQLLRVYSGFASEWWGGRDGDVVDAVSDHCFLARRVDLPIPAGTDRTHPARHPATP